MEIFTVRKNCIEVFKVIKELKDRWYVGPGVVPGGYIKKGKKYHTSFEEATKLLVKFLKEEDVLLSEKLIAIRCTFDALEEGNIILLKENRVILEKKNNKDMERYHKIRKMRQKARHRAIDLELGRN